MNRFFDELMESVQQMDDIVQGKQAPSREFEIDALLVRNIRKATGLDASTLCRDHRCSGSNIEELGTRATRTYRACQGITTRNT